MKKGIAIVITVSLLFCLFVTPASAENSKKKVSVNNSGIVAASNANGDISLFSTMPFKGPLKGATKSGSVKKMSSHQNITTIQLALAFIADVAKIPKSAISGTILAAEIVKNNSKNQYYTRTKYVSSPTKEMYYYKYDFYTSSSYSKKIGTEYSYVYSIMY